MRLAFACLLALSAAVVHAEEDRGPLKRTHVPLAQLHPDLAFRDLDVAVGLLRIYYPGAQATPITTVPAWVAKLDEAGVAARVPLALSLWPGLPKLTVDCDSGGSADPSCHLLRNADDPDSSVFDAPGTDFVFAANGDIYTYGHTDNMYDQRSLFRWDGKRFAEVKQAYAYVGLEGKAKVPLALTASRGGDAAHAQIHIAAGAALTILVNDTSTDPASEYLVLTRDGLTGWAHLPQHPDGTTDVEGLYFRGD
jgi:hypothetical protein